MLIPQDLQTFTYDHDGNLTGDGVWSYTWDAENRLIVMETPSGSIGAGLIPSASARRLEFKYDYLGRRVEKIVRSGWNGSIFATLSSQHRYLYDGWNLIAEYSVTATSPLTLSLVRSYTWGLDIVRSLASAGGVGALLQITDHGSGKSYLPAYDANGNVTALLNGDTGTSGALAASYEYGPFGELVRREITDATVAGQPFQFSTKFTDAETGLVYYGHRYYDPRNGRFLGRDPIGENGGVNLYAFAGNDGINRWDYLGMEPNWGTGDNWLINPNTGDYDWYDPESGMFRNEYEAHAQFLNDADAFHQESLQLAEEEAMLQEATMQETENPFHIPTPINDHKVITAETNALVASTNEMFSKPMENFNLLEAIISGVLGLPSGTTGWREASALDFIEDTSAPNSNSGTAGGGASRGGKTASNAPASSTGGMRMVDGTYITNAGEGYAWAYATASRNAQPIQNPLPFVTASTLEKAAAVGEITNYFVSITVGLMGAALNKLPGQAITDISEHGGQWQTGIPRVDEKIAFFSQMGQLLGQVSEYGADLRNFGFSQANESAGRYQSYMRGEWSAQFYPSPP